MRWCWRKRITHHLILRYLPCFPCDISCLGQKGEKRDESSFFFLFFKIYYLFIYLFISWMLITLQYCSGFCHTLTGISHGYTCIPHPGPPPISLSTRSLWVFPVHQVRALVSCIQPGLVLNKCAGKPWRGFEFDVLFFFLIIEISYRR